MHSTVLFNDKLGYILLHLALTSYRLNKINGVMYVYVLTNCIPLYCEINTAFLYFFFSITPSMFMDLLL